MVSIEAVAVGVAIAVAIGLGVDDGDEAALRRVGNTPLYIVDRSMQTRREMTH